LIRTINFSDPPPSPATTAWPSCGRECSPSHKQLPESLALLTKKTALASGLIEATDHQIDVLVYELYWLTEDEIAIVEGR